jgi:hypothetical protein
MIFLDFMLANLSVTASEVSIFSEAKLSVVKIARFFESLYFHITSEVIFNLFRYVETSFICCYINRKGQINY